MHNARTETHGSLAGRFSEHPALVRDDFTALLEHVLPQAAQHLVYADWFAPFAVGHTEAGTTDITAEDTADGKLYEALGDALRRGAVHGDLRATALVWDATATPANGGEPTDLIVTRLDHQQGPSATAYVPYARKVGHVDLQDVYIEDDAGDIFPAQMA